MKLLKYTLTLICFALFFGCDTEDNSQNNNASNVTFNFTHNWDGVEVNSSDFNQFLYITENGQSVSIERLRYVISNFTFTNSSGNVILVNGHSLIDLTTDSNLQLPLLSNLPNGTYSIRFTFGLDNEYNSLNHPDLNSANFNVPDMLGGGYHYMQFDGKFINNNMEEQGFNYHAIRAVDNPGENPTFPQNTFFTVNLGSVTINNNTIIEVKMDIAQWFKDPNTWDLNQLNQMLMPNSTAQILMFENGQNVFDLGTVTQ